MSGISPTPDEGVPSKTLLTEAWLLLRLRRFALDERDASASSLKKNGTSYWPSAWRMG
jgi:hypothetical protein